MTDTGDTSENLGGGESHHDSEVLLNEASDDPPFSTGSKNSEQIGWAPLRVAGGIDV